MENHIQQIIDEAFSIKYNYVKVFLSFLFIHFEATRYTPVYGTLRSNEHCNNFSLINDSLTVPNKPQLTDGDSFVAAKNDFN